METHRPRHGDTGAVVEKETTGLCGDTIEAFCNFYFIRFLTFRNVKYAFNW